MAWGGTAPWTTPLWRRGGDGDPPRRGGGGFGNSAPRGRGDPPLPGGEPFTQRVAEELARRDHLVLLSGRYEGFDARVEAFVTRSLSIGDYVLMGGGGSPGGAGGHRPAHPWGDRGSGKPPEGFLCPRAPGPPPLHPPPEFRGLRVPEVLLSGNHPEVDRWRRREALRKTLAVRPELVREARLGPLEVAWLAEIDREG